MPGSVRISRGCRGVVAEFLAQLTDVHTQVVALAAVTLTPDFAQQVFLGQQLARMAHEDLEQHASSVRVRCTTAPSASHTAAGEVDLDAVDPHERGNGMRLRNAAQRRTYRGQQLLGVERFRDVVVGPGVQGADLLGLLVVRGRGR